jgi:hypothetical protein
MNNMNYDYLSEPNFDLMTEDEFFAYLDAKAAYLKTLTRPLTPYHKKLAVAVGQQAENPNQ